jgi:hypothetical protein
VYNEKVKKGVEIHSVEVLIAGIAKPEPFLPI